MPQEKPDLRNLGEPVRFKRALTLVLMTLVLPGSAQIVAGSKRAGRWAWRVVAGLIAIVVFLVLLGLVWRSGTINLMARPGTLRIVQVLLILLAIGWAALFVDAYRLGRPLTLERNHRLITSILDGVLVFAVVGALIYGSMIVNTQRDFVASVFGSGQKSKAEKGRYNVLLLGGDSGADRIGTRPDSITLASIDADTGRTVLIGLPRNLSKVPFPAGTAMAKQFPDGFQWKNCGAECLLNAVYTYAANHKDLFPGDPHPGVTATKQAVEAVTGMKVNYYVLIDLAGFRDLLNAVGGITLDIGKRVPIGGGSSPIKGYIESRQEPAPGRLPRALVRAVPGRVVGLRADDPAEVRDVGDAEPAVATDRADQVPGHRVGQQTGGQDRHPGRRAGHLHRPRAGREEAAGVKLLRGPAVDPHRRSRLRTDPYQGRRGDREVGSAGQGGLGGRR